MTLQPSWTARPELDRTLALRARTNAPRFSWPVGPTSWEESAARVRRRHRHVRLRRWLAVLVLVVALTAAVVIWQRADGRPLELLREGRDLVGAAVERLRGYAE